MSRDNKRKYLSAYIPEVTPKETPKRSGMKSDGRYAEIEAAVAALSDMMAKQNRDSLDAMYNIDMDNMSSSMRRLFRSYDDGITKAQAEIKTWADAQEAGFKAVAEWQNETNKSISSIDAKANANGASITSLTQFRKTVEDGTISSISSINQKADANAASITSLNQWKGTTASSLAAVQSLATQNEAKISSLTSWKNTAEGEIDGLAASVAAIDQIADENGASISQIVEAVGEDGEVNAASIVAAVNAAGSSVKIDADHVDITGFVTYESLENDGEAYINGNNIGLVSDSDGDSTARLRFWLEDDIFADEDNYLIGEIYTSGTSNDLEDCTLRIRSYASKMKITAGGNLDISSTMAVSLESGTSYVEIIADGSVEIYSGDDTLVDCYYMTILPGASYKSSRVVDYAWQFFDDGIYFNGYKMVSTPS